MHAFVRVLTLVVLGAHLSEIVFHLPLVMGHRLLAAGQYIVKSDFADVFVVELWCSLRQRRLITLNLQSLFKCELFWNGLVLSVRLRNMSHFKWDVFRNVMYCSVLRNLLIRC